jgi:hypothetical protein
MNRAFVSRRRLLAGTSAIAILVGAGAAQAAIWDIPGFYTFTAPSTGAYAYGAIGAMGGRAVNTFLQFQGGTGVEITGEILLTKGESLEIVVGGPGESGAYAGGGGGLSAIAGNAFLVVAGGGGGAGESASGFPGQGVPNGGTAGGTFGGAGGVAGNGGGGGTESFAAGAFSSGGGGSGLLGSGGNGVGDNAGQGAIGFAGGTGVENGGFGGGGGASAYSGGGGGGFSGGGGGSPFIVGPYGGGVVFSGGGGGGSFAAGVASAAISASSGTLNHAGFVEVIDESASAPELSTWAMMLAGFSALGAMLLRRKRGAKPA